MKRLSLLIIILLVASILFSCGQETKSLKEEIKMLKDENAFLKAENVGLKKEIEELYKKLEGHGQQKVSRKTRSWENKKLKNCQKPNIPGPCHFFYEQQMISLCR
jgi:regulator of replication initiation timing